MKSSVLLFNKIFGKASLLSKFALLGCVAMGYCVVNLYKNIGELNSSIISCHQARIADINSLFERINKIEPKVNRNTEDLEEVKERQEIGLNSVN